MDSNTVEVTLADADKRRWVPVRAGDRYCAPACGNGCSWEDYVAARAWAQGLCEGLGPGWTPRVAESLGWYASAFGPSGRLYLVPNRVSGYTCFVPGKPYETGGVVGLTGSGDTPRAAIEMSLGLIRERMAYYAEVLEPLAGWVEGLNLTARPGAV